MYPFFENFYDVFVSFLVWLIGFLFLLGFKNIFNISVRKVLILYIWHTVFSILYAFYVIGYIGDSLMYYFFPWERSEWFGTGFVIKLTQFLKNQLFLSFFGAFMFYNIIGSIGLLAFYSSLRSVTIQKSKQIQLLAMIVVFLPSVSFWSSAIGKDGISFASTCMVLWGVLSIKKRYLAIIIGILLMLLVRPHVAGFIVASLTLTLIFLSGVGRVKKFVLLILSIIATAIMLPLGMDVVGLSSIDNLQEYFNKRAGLNMDVGSSLDIKSLSYPMKLFTYAFRPLPFEAHNIFALYTSIENLFLLGLFMWFVFSFIKKRVKISTVNVKFMFIYVFITWSIFASVTANLGIATRQKWMFMPMLIFLIFLYIGRVKKTPPQCEIVQK